MNFECIKSNSIQYVNELKTYQIIYHSMIFKVLIKSTYHNSNSIHVKEYMKLVANKTFSMGSKL